MTVIDILLRDDIVIVRDKVWYFRHTTDTLKSWLTADRIKGYVETFCKEKGYRLWTSDTDCIIHPSDGIDKDLDAEYFLAQGSLITTPNVIETYIKVIKLVNSSK